MIKQKCVKFCGYLKKGERGTGNGQRENEVNHFPRNLHSEQFQGAEFIDGNSFSVILETKIFQVLVLDEERQMLQF